MFDPSYIRFQAIGRRRRAEADSAGRDALIAGLMADAMIGLRQDRGAATREALLDCGFTADELARLGDRAKDEAAARWHGRMSGLPDFGPQGIGPAPLAA